MNTTHSKTSDPSHTCLEHHGCAQVAETAETVDLDRLSWRALLGRFGSAAARIHRYRDLRTRMLHRALCESDSHFDGDRSCRDE